MMGLRRYWWTIPAAVMVVLVAAIFRPELRSLVGPRASATPDPPPPTLSAAPSAAPATASPAPSGTPVAPQPPLAPAHEAKPRPTTIDGKDLDVWLAMLRGAAMRGDGAVAADAFLAVVAIDPDELAKSKVKHDAVTAAHLAATAQPEIGDRVFAVLAGDSLGHHACDILYRLTSIHGGSHAAKRAALLLDDEVVLSRATPAMRIALEVRDTPCKSRPVLFDRAAEHGDSRTLYLLQAMRGDTCGQISCCMKANTTLDQTIGTIRTRLADAR